MRFHGGKITDKVTFSEKFKLSQKDNKIEYSDSHRNRKFSIEIKDKELNEEVANFVCNVIECVLT